MRILTAFAFSLFFLTFPATASAADAACDKPQAEMTPDEYVACVSVGGAKEMMRQEAPPPRSASGFSDGAPSGAGRGVTAAGTSEADACSKAKARAGNTARGSCNCSQKSSSRYECTIATAAVVRD